MGISLLLEILPERINKKEWENVYEETLKLIDQYPFAMLKNDKVYGIERLFLDKTVELGHEDKYWEICGDLETKERGEIFSLHRDLDYYMKRRKNTDLSEDIILMHLNDNIAPRVFSEKTQGKNYHKYILGIGALIESRFEGAAILYGDFNKKQAEISVEWANNILDRPINLPILVDYKKLYKKLKVLRSDENILKEFYKLAYGKKELNNFVCNNFSKVEIDCYYRKRMKKYKSATQVGLINILVDLLNMGYSLENLSDICCFSEDGPNFNKDDFVKALCSTWVFVPRDRIKAMDIFEKASSQATNVNGQMLDMYLEMKGFQGRNIDRYIPISEFKKSLKSIFEEKNKLEEIIDERYGSIIKKLDKQIELINEVDKKHEDILKANKAYSKDRLLKLQELFNVDKKTIQAVASVKKLTNHMIDNAQALGADKIFPEAADKHSQNQLLAKIINKEGLVLSREAWDWLENIKDYESWMALVLMIPLLKDNKMLLELILEDEDLFNNLVK